MADLKEMWKETGKEFYGAVESLGKSIVKTAKVGIKKADEWANGEESKTKNGRNGNE